MSLTIFSTDIKLPPRRQTMYTRILRKLEELLTDNDEVKTQILAKACKCSESEVSFALRLLKSAALVDFRLVWGGCKHGQYRLWRRL